MEGGTPSHVISSALPGSGSPRALRLLCLHGHGGYAERTCIALGKFLRSVQAEAQAASEGGQPTGRALEVECRCMEAPFAEPSRRREGRQWWRYDDNDRGDRPDDWAEMERAASRIAAELEASPQPYDGVLGFSQGAEMVHTLSLLQHRDDPRLQGIRVPRFVMSLSGAVNPGHFEAVGGGGPPRDCPGPRWGPSPGELRTPCLFLGDLKQDGWYSAARFGETLGLYSDATLVTHDQKHSVPVLDSDGAKTVHAFLSRFAGTE